MPFPRRFTVLSLWFLAYAALLHGQSKVDTLNLTFTTIDVPGATATTVQGINTAGQMVGGYSPTAGNPGAFLYSGRTFTLLNYPNSDSTSVGDINDSAQIVGSAYVRNHTASVSFIYANGTFTTVRAPGDAATFAWGINNGGTLVGGDGLTLSGTKGFELIGKTFTNVSPPGVYTYIYATGINNVGEVVGFADNIAFSYQSGKFHKLSFPGSSMTEAWGVNDSGVVVGWYGTTSSFSGFALSGGKYVSINYPGASATFAFGINAGGQIVGAYVINNVTHGFVSSPITPKDFARP